MINLTAIKEKVKQVREVEVKYTTTMLGKEGLNRFIARTRTQIDGLLELVEMLTNELENLCSIHPFATK